MTQTVDQTLIERGNRYGPFKGHAHITQSLKLIMQGVPEHEGLSFIDVKTNWDKLPYSHRESLEMIAHKIGRILNGDPNYADSWHDIAGYAKLVEDEINEEKQ